MSTDERVQKIHGTAHFASRAGFSLIILLASTFVTSNQSLAIDNDVLAEPGGLNSFSPSNLPLGNNNDLPMNKLKLPEINLPDQPNLSSNPDHRPTDNVSVITPYANPNAPFNQPLANLNELTLQAQLTEESPALQDGVVWRVFSPDPSNDDTLPLVATSMGGTAHFSLPEGSYLVHVAFGRAGATKRITLRNSSRQEKMILDAGGLTLNAKSPDGKAISDKYLRFSVYEGDDESNDRSLVVPDIKPDTIIRLNSGNYHIVSNYGSTNATVRADIRVTAGKLTEATVEHKAAELTLKLLRDQGGEALADTSWSILNTNGDIVHESVGAYATLVLAAGEYIAIAKNKDRLYQRDFTVDAGKNADIDVFAKAEFEVDSDQVD